MLQTLQMPTGMERLGQPIGGWEGGNLQKAANSGRYAQHPLALEGATSRH